MKLVTAMRPFGLAILLAVTTIGVANAQTAVSDAKIHAFLTAVMSVRKVIEEWKPRIDGAESQKAANDLAAQANAEAVAAIEAIDGISPDEYNEIAQAAQTDPELAARIEAIYQQSFKK
jgi:Domain of unknown function (DUF4168)